MASKKAQQERPKIIDEIIDNVYTTDKVVDVEKVIKVLQSRLNLIPDPITLVGVGLLLEFADSVRKNMIKSVDKKIAKDLKKKQKKS